jgi:hypothetical protein
MLNVKGRSLEAILDERVAVGVNTRSDAPDPLFMAEWPFMDYPEWIARYMFIDVMNGQQSSGDVISQLHWDPKSYPTVTPATPGSDNLFPEDTIPETNFQIDWVQKPASLYKAIKDLADIYDFGFRFYRNGDTGQLFFNIYTGSDRTLQQETLSPIVFSSDLQNLMDTTEFNTIEKTKNVAFVMWVNPTGTVYTELVYAPEIDPTTATGLDRHTIYVAGEVQEDDQADPALISAALQRQGLDELAKHRAFTGFDGEISQYTQYKYDQDYFLGDLVVMQDVDGFRNNMRVTEQIFVSDNEGDRSYPTLSFRNFIQPGSWEDFGYRAWEDMGLTEYWADQP